MKKILSIIGMLSGIALIICGVRSFDIGDIGSYGEHPKYSSYRSIYDNGYTKFGGDYYTYSNNNMALAADNTAHIAGNTARIAKTNEALKTAFCFFMIFLGIITSCGFGIVFISSINKSKPTLAIETVKKIPENIENNNYLNTTDEAIIIT